MDRYTIHCPSGEIWTETPPPPASARYTLPLASPYTTEVPLGDHTGRARPLTSSAIFAGIGGIIGLGFSLRF